MKSGINFKLIFKYFEIKFVDNSNACQAYD